MNRTLTCLLGLILAGPLAAQHDQSVEQKAAEMLRLSAEKAAAGHETAAAELAMKAAEMLTKQADIHREHARNVERETAIIDRQLLELERGVLAEALEDAERNQQIRELVIVQDAYNDALQLGSVNLEMAELHSDLEDQIIELQSLGYLGEPQLGEVKYKVRVAPHGQHGEDHGDLGLFEVHEDHGEHGEHDVFTWDTMENHFTPMDGGDLHEELRAIHHELQQLRHELHMLRSSMNGGQGRGMRGNRGGRGGRWQGHGSQDMWVPEGAMPQGQMQFLFAPMDRMEPMEPMEMRESMMLPRMKMRMHGLPHDFNDQIREEIILNLGLEGMEGMGGEHDLKFEFHGEGDEDFDFDLEMPEGVETNSQIKVIINGEVYEGDAARKKLHELQGGEGEHGRIRLGGAMPHPPSPPEPPKAPSRGNWRRSENHEDL